MPMGLPPFHPSFTSPAGGLPPSLPGGEANDNPPARSIDARRDALSPIGTTGRMTPDGLQTAAFLIGRGEAPDAVAARLGITHPQDLAELRQLAPR